MKLVVIKEPTWSFSNDKINFTSSLASSLNNSMIFSLSSLSKSSSTSTASSASINSITSAASSSFNKSKKSSESSKYAIISDNFSLPKILAKWIFSSSSSKVKTSAISESWYWVNSLYFSLLFLLDLMINKISFKNSSINNPP